MTWTGIDTSGPIIAQMTGVTNPTNDQTPNYTFSSTESGTISYAGNCSSVTTGATQGINIITLNTLADGIYDNCTIKVTDALGNMGNVMPISTFTIDTVAPTVQLAIASSYSTG